MGEFSRRSRVHRGEVSRFQTGKSAHTQTTHFRTAKREWMRAKRDTYKGERVHRYNAIKELMMCLIPSCADIQEDAGLMP